MDHKVSQQINDVVGDNIKALGKYGCKQCQSVM